MTHEPLISQTHKSGFKNPWVLALLTLILVVLAVNATFIWLSTQNRSTLVDREYKAKNRKTSEEVVQELGGQHALGWKVTMNRPQRLVLGEPVLYEVSVIDRAGQPVRGEMIVEAYRASDASKDFETRFSEVSIGQYQGAITFPLKGYWELHLRITRGPDVFNVVTERIRIEEPK